MKAESEKKLVKIIQLLKGNEMYKAVVTELQNILACEANEVKLGKLDLYKFVAKDDLRPVLQGVYHNEGWQTASDGNILISVKQDYEEEREGKVIAKDGSEIEGRYPNWQSVIPVYTNEYKTFRMDMKELTDAMRKVKAHDKVYGKNSCRICLAGGIWFIPEKLLLFATAMKEAGVDELLYLSPERGIIVKTDKMQLLLMPQFPPTAEELADDYMLYLTLQGVE